MSGYKRVNFYELCRLCATNQQKEKTHIFEEEGRKIQLQNKIQSCLSLKVCENDFLPKVVCSQCLRTLEECYTFRKECQGSETMLSSYFNNFRYTEDFKKSGKVYIKDTSPDTSLITTASTTVTVTTVTSNTTNLNSLQNSSTNVSFVHNNTINNNIQNSQQENISFGSVVNNINVTQNVKNGQKLTDTQPKVNQSQVAYNLNTVNFEALKNLLQSATKNDTFANVTVNANGEIIGIGPIVSFDAILSQKQPKNIIPDNKPVIQGRKRHKSADIQQQQQKRTTDGAFIDDSIIKIDLTEGDSQSVETKASKIAYALKMNDTNASVPELNPTQLVHKFVSSSQLSQATKLAEAVSSEPTQQVYASSTSNVGYISQVNTSNGVNVVSNVNLQSANLGTVNIPSSLNSSFSSNLNANTTYSHLGQNVSSQNINTSNANPILNFHQNNVSKSQGRKNFNVGSLPTLDLNSHVDAGVLDKSTFSSTMNILNITSAGSNLLTNLNLTSNNIKAEEELNGNSNNFMLNNCNVSKLNNNTSSTNINANDSVNNGTSNLNLPPTSGSNFVPIQSSNPLLETPLKTHMCEICKKAFKRKEHLYQHVKLHTGFRPFKCDSCEKCFMRKEHLLRHMTAHSGQKNFTCNICEKSFSRNDNLLKHKKTHEKQSSFTCQVCQKQFVMKHYYTAHKLTHETERCSLNQLWGVLKA